MPSRDKLGGVVAEKISSIKMAWIMEVEVLATQVIQYPVGLSLWCPC